MLKLENIHFSYEQSVLKEFSFELEAGDICSLAGPSGSGKSTLAKIIAGHITPDQGKVMLNGLEVTGQPSRKILHVDQEDDLFPWLSVQKQITRFTKNSHSNPNDILSMLELQDVTDFYPAQLSGGMKKRLAMARAIMLEPEVIIFDECLSSLDHQLKKRLLEKLIPHLKASNATVIFISHLPEEISDYSNRSLQLD